MLEELENIAAELGVSFTFGELKAFNVTVDKLAVWPIIYHEGYTEGREKPDVQGLNEVAYSVTLWFLRPSKLSHKPDERQPTITELRDLGLAVLNRLRKSYRIPESSFREGINLQDKNLDGVRFQFTATPKNLKPAC